MMEMVDGGLMTLSKVRFYFCEDVGIINSEDESCDLMER